MIHFAVAFLAALAASLLLTPVVRNLARRWGFVDRPDGGRKAHAEPVALGGGAAVLLATLAAIALAVGAARFSDIPLSRLSDSHALLGLLVGALLIVLLGLADDIAGLRGRYKLVGQVIVASVVIYFGIRIESVALFDNPVELGLLALPFTLFWLLGAINAINLIDGIDGLASSVGFVLCLTIAAITSWQGNTEGTIIMLALAGALLGFLRFNFAPASIFLGDTGSMLIGLLIGTIAIHSSIKSAATVALAVPCAVWSIPILDSAAAILRRKLTGRSLFAADRGHLHHSLLIRGWSVRQAVLFIGLICATTCLSAVLSIYFGNELIALFTVLAVAAFLIVTRTFGHIEFALLKDRFRFTALPFVGREDVDESRVHESRIQLQGARQWSKLWTAIVEAAEDYNLTRLKLIIHIPKLHEDFFASWEPRREIRDGHDPSWQAIQPLVVEGEIVGQLEVCGVPTQGSTLGHMVQVLDFLEPIEEDVRHIMEELELDKATVRVGRAQPAANTKPQQVSAESATLVDTPSLESEQALAKG